MFWWKPGTIWIQHLVDSLSSENDPWIMFYLACLVGSFSCVSVIQLTFRGGYRIATFLESFQRQEDWAQTNNWRLRWSSFHHVGTVLRIDAANENFWLREVHYQLSWKVDLWTFFHGICKPRIANVDSFRHNIPGILFSYSSRCFIVQFFWFLICHPRLLSSQGNKYGERIGFIEGLIPIRNVPLCGPEV